MIYMPNLPITSQPSSAPVKPAPKQQTAVSLRLARSSDVPTLSALNRRGFGEAHLDAFYTTDLNDYLADTFNRHALMADLSDRANCAIVAETKAGIVGNVWLKRAALPSNPKAAAPVELARLYLAEGAIGKGVGRALMRGALKTAVRLGYRTCWLGVWQKNKRAIQFYQRWGFETVGTMTLAVGQSAPKGWLMARPLPAN